MYPLTYSSEGEILIYDSATQTIKVDGKIGLSVDPSKSLTADELKILEEYIRAYAQLTYKNVIGVRFTSDWGY